MKALVGAFNQEKALDGAFSVITNLRMELFQALVLTGSPGPPAPGQGAALSSGTTHTLQSSLLDKGVTASNATEITKFNFNFVIIYLLLA